jgi:hypothetical protein
MDSRYKYFEQSSCRASVVPTFVLFDFHSCSRVLSFTSTPLVFVRYHSRTFNFYSTKFFTSFARIATRYYHGCHIQLCLHSSSFLGLHLSAIKSVACFQAALRTRMFGARRYDREIGLSRHLLKDSSHRPVDELARSRYMYSCGRNARRMRWCLGCWYVISLVFTTLAS